MGCIQSSRSTKGCSNSIEVSAIENNPKFDIISNWVEAARDGHHTGICQVLQHRPIDLVNDLELVTSQIDEKCDYCGNYPIHLAVLADDIKLLQILLRQGANVNAVNDRGESPLHLASGMDNTAIVKYLIRNGADLEIRDNAGVAINPSGHYPNSACNLRVYWTKRAMELLADDY